MTTPMKMAGLFAGIGGIERGFHDADGVVGSFPGRADPSRCPRTAFAPSRSRRARGRLPVHRPVSSRAHSRDWGFAVGSC